MLCNTCPRGCNVDRSSQVGFCGSGAKIKIAKHCLFEYEEPCISGKGGSGAIFFSGCSLKCVYCQNYEISSLCQGKEISLNELAEIFKELENMGAENINLVNPTHYAFEIVQALKIYRPKIPIVYNTHGYEKIETLQMLLPYVDVFLTDFKYFDNALAKKYSHCANYVETAQKAIKFMCQNKPNIIQNDMMKQGVIIRHLVLPLATSDSIIILEWIKQNTPNCLVSLMAQYTPYAEACKFKEINRKITKREYTKVLDKFLELGLDGYVQEMESATTLYIPKWDF